MRIATSTFTNGFINEIGQLQSQENNLQEQVSSGLSISQPGDNPSVMAQFLNLQSSSDANSQYQKNINQLQSSASTAATAMNSLQQITSQVSEIATSAGNGTTSASQMASYAEQVQQLLQQAVQLANTQDANGNYIFGGTANNTPAFTTTTDSNGNVTGVTYQGNTSVAQSQIGPNTSVTAQVVGANTTGSGPQGLFVDSRTGANLFNDIISLYNNLQSGNNTAINSTDAPALQKDDDNVIDHVSANGVMQSALTAAGDIASSQGTTLTEEISNDTSADLATTMTNLSRTQNAYEAALESGMMVMNFSLVSLLA